jgi:hypothetical protein
VTSCAGRQSLAAAPTAAVRGGDTGEALSAVEWYRILFLEPAVRWEYVEADGGD